MDHRLPGVLAFQQAIYVDQEHAENSPAIYYQELDLLFAM